MDSRAVVKEADGNIILLIIVVARILFLCEVWGFRRLMPIENGMTYAVKYPKTPQTIFSVQRRFKCSSVDESAPAPTENMV